MPYPASPPLRGEIYWVDWTPARGSEQEGRRPAVVISMDSLNRAVNTVVVAACTTRIRNLRTAVNLPAGRPLQQAGQIIPIQLMTIDQHRLDGYMGRLSLDQIEDLKVKLRLCWGL